MMRLSVCEEAQSLALVAIHVVRPLGSHLVHQATSIFFFENSDVVSALKNQPNFMHPDRMIDAYPNLEAWSQKME